MPSQGKVYFCTQINFQSPAGLSNLEEMVPGRIVYFSQQSKPVFDRQHSSELLLVLWLSDRL